MSHVVRLVNASTDKLIYQVCHWDPQRGKWVGVETFAGDAAKSEAFALCHYLNGGHLGEPR